MFTARYGLHFYQLFTLLQFQPISVYIILLSTENLVVTYRQYFRDVTLCPGSKISARLEVPYYTLLQGILAVLYRADEGTSLSSSPRTRRRMPED